jgi:hypothetical protein
LIDPKEDAMPAFMKLDGIDSVGGEHGAKDGTSNTLMIGEHVLTSVSHAAGTSVLEFSVENVPNNILSNEHTGSAYFAEAVNLIGVGGTHGANPYHPFFPFSDFL